MKYTSGKFACADSGHGLWVKVGPSYLQLLGRHYTGHFKSQAEFEAWVNKWLQYHCRQPVPGE